MPHTRKDALRQDLVEAQRALLDALDRVAADDWRRSSPNEGAALDKRGHLSSGVEGSTEDNFRLVAFHKRTHTKDIRAAFAPTTAAGPSGMSEHSDHLDRPSLTSPSSASAYASIPCRPAMD